MTRGVVALPDDVSVMAMAHRHGLADPRPQLAPIEDWGRFRGAFATTVSHDSHNLCVFGREPDDMAVAANALIAAGGGMAVAKDGALVALLPLPVAGLVADDDPAAIADGFRAVKDGGRRRSPNGSRPIACSRPSSAQASPAMPGRTSPTSGSPTAAPARSGRWSWPERVVRRR